MRAHGGRTRGSRTARWAGGGAPPTGRETPAAAATALKGAGAGPPLQALALLAEVLVAVLLARWTGARVVGDLAVASVVGMLIVMVGGVQIDTQVARSADRGWCVAALPWAVVAGVACGVLALVAGTLLSAAGRPGAGNALFALSVGLALHPLMGWARGAFAAAGRAIAAAGVAAARPAARLAMLTVVWATFRGDAVTATQVAALFAAADVAVTSWAVVAARRSLPGALTLRGAVLQEIVRAFPSLAVSSGLWLVIIRMDVIMVGMFVSAPAAGRYLTAVRLGEIPMALFGAAMFTYLPAGASLSTERQLPALYRRLTRATTAMLMPAVVGVATWGDRLVAWVFGQAFVLPRVVYVIAAAAALVHIATGPSGATLIARRRHRELAMIALTGVGLNVALSPLLTITLGVPGAAAASAGTLLLVNGLYLWHVRREVRVSSRSWRYGAWLVASVVAASAALLVVRAVMGGGLDGAVTAAAAGLIVTALAARLDTRTWDALRELTGSLRIPRRRLREDGSGG